MVVGANEKFNIPKLLKNFSYKSTEIHGCSINNLDYFSSFSPRQNKIIFKKFKMDVTILAPIVLFHLLEGKADLIIF